MNNWRIDQNLLEINFAENQKIVQKRLGFNFAEKHKNRPQINWAVIFHDTTPPKTTSEAIFNNNNQPETFWRSILMNN